MNDRIINYLLIAIIVVLSIVAVALPIIRSGAATGPVAEATEEADLTARLQVTSSPADVEILLNGELRGRTPVEGHQRFRSGVLELADLTPGSYEVVARRPDAEPITRTVELSVGENHFLHLMVWHPDAVVYLKDGRKLVGMIVGRSGSYLDLATSPRSVSRLFADDVARTSRTLSRVEGPTVETARSPESGELEYLVEPFPGER